MKDIKNLGWSLLGYGATFLLAFGGSSMAARTLGPEGRGTLSAMMVLPSLLVYLAILGGGQSVTYFTARNPDSAGRYLGTATFCALAASIVIAAAAVPYQWHVFRDYPEGVRISGLLFLLFIPMNIMFAMPTSTFQGLQRFPEFNGLRIMPQCLYFLVLAVGWIAAIHTPGFYATAYLLACALVAAPVAWFAYMRIVGQPLTVDKGTLKETFSYGIYSTFSSLPSAANRNVDQVFIAALLPPAQLGWYAVAASWGCLLAPIVGAIGSIVFPKLAESSAARSEEYFKLILRWTMACVLALTFVLYVAAPWAVPIVFGHGFDAAIQPAQILALGGAFFALNIVLEDCLRGLGRPRIPMLAESAGLMVTIGFMRWALRHGGIVGAAWLSVSSYATSTVFLLIALRAEVGRTLTSAGRDFTEDAVKALKILGKKAGAMQIRPECGGNS
ncbi:MAG: oligosaccharide flippase family protein [Elusimicrobia bacterium]|nr:oligosaccharide flippase family protein [Elusimicrobiota bacterium]